MSRFLTLMMIVILVIAHGSSVAAAACRHESSLDHVAALQSSDATISAAAFGEEAAGKVASKKGAATDGGSVAWPSDMLPMPELTVPFRASEPVERHGAADPVLVGASVRPLLEPPSD
jgi:hypothetical protein